MKMANESSLKDLLHNLLPAPQRGCLRWHKAYPHSLLGAVTWLHYIRYDIMQFHISSVVSPSFYYLGSYVKTSLGRCGQSTNECLRVNMVCLLAAAIL